MSTTNAHLQCLCGSIRVPASLIHEKDFPIKTHFCHCNTCRQTSGSLGGLFVKLTGSPEESTLGACTVYTLPQGRVDRYFCSECGTRTFNHVTDTGYWSACAGMVERNNESAKGDVSKVTAHTFVADTTDGGLAARLKRIGPDDIPCYASMPGASNTPMTPDELSRLTQQTKTPNTPQEPTNRLHVSCHCGSIQFQISPPTPAQAHGPTARWLRANGTKYRALNCVCRYCRLAFGTPIASYTYVMPENIHAVPSTSTSTSNTKTDTALFNYTSSTPTPLSFTNSDSNSDSTVHQTSAFPTLKSIISSPDSRRTFCGTCGASIFYECTTRPQCVNVSVGILRAEAGCLARDWIEFDWGDVSWREEANDAGMVGVLELGVEGLAD